MLKVGMYVRCPMDDPNDNPREFFFGRVVSINELSGQCKVAFFDTNGVSTFFGVLPEIPRRLQDLKRCVARSGSKAIHKGVHGFVFAAETDSQSAFTNYYFGPSKNEVRLVPENEIEISYNDGQASALEQAKNFEFANPIFHAGHVAAIMAMHEVKRSLYGLDEIAGSKILLKPYQIRTILRCVQSFPCRYMIADEVGLGKTIESICVLKVFFKNRQNVSAAIVVPDALVEQWRTELAFKFRLFEGANASNNKITLIPFSSLKTGDLRLFDFVIIDEVHRCIHDSKLYETVLAISTNTENIIMLSATPVRKRDVEYRKLLTLIQPNKYQTMSSEAFGALLALQTSVTRKVYDSYQCIETLKSEISSAKGAITKDVEEAFDDLLSSLETLDKTIKDEYFKAEFEKIRAISIEESIPMILSLLTYVTDNYQMEKALIRNRRNSQNFRINERRLSLHQYDLNTDWNNAELNAYRALCDWADAQKETVGFFAVFSPLISAFFSSSQAFLEAVNKLPGEITVPPDLPKWAKLWYDQERRTLTSIKQMIDDDAEKYASRPVNIVDYIDQECSGKVLVFTDNQATFDYYRKLFTEYFGPKQVCFFSSTMKQDELDLNAYRFQHSKTFRIMLSDQTGGEGRNFQNAEAIVHIDVPWDANQLEQRIGRLDRIGRRDGFAVESAVFSPLGTLEEDLVTLWTSGVPIFVKSQSGLEIIMGDINSLVQKAIQEDLNYGLKNILPKMQDTISELEKTIKIERYFDVSGQEYSELNRAVDEFVDKFSRNEAKWFAQALKFWCPVAGFNFDTDPTDKSILTFHSTSFSAGSAKKVFFIPPEMKRIIDDKLNQMQNRVRALNNEKEVQYGLQYIRGSLDRQVAIANDYLHFFAPGDEIFDSIIDNAIGLYRGQTAAISIKGSLNWMGFVFMWIVKIDEAKMFRLGINPRFVDEFKCFMPLVKSFDVIPYSVGAEAQDQEVFNEYLRFINTRSALKAKGELINHGSRDDGAIDKFRSAFPKMRWEITLSEAVAESEKKIRKAIQTKTEQGIKRATEEMDRMIRAKRSASAYYSEHEGPFDLEKQRSAIIQLLSSLKIELSSICFFRVYK